MAYFDAQNLIKFYKSKKVKFSLNLNSLRYHFLLRITSKTKIRKEQTPQTSTSSTKHFQVFLFIACFCVHIVVYFSLILMFLSVRVGFHSISLTPMAFHTRLVLFLIKKIVWVVWYFQTQIRPFLLFEYKFFRSEQNRVVQKI
jgi:cell shape-determining protein MreC